MNERSFGVFVRHFQVEFWRGDATGSTRPRRSKGVWSQFSFRPVSADGHEFVFVSSEVDPRAGVSVLVTRASIAWLGVYPPLAALACRPCPHGASPAPAGRFLRPTPLSGRAAAICHGNCAFFGQRPTSQPGRGGDYAPSQTPTIESPISRPEARKPRNEHEHAFDARAPTWLSSQTV